MGSSIRIGQNIQNEVSVERSIFDDVVAYHFLGFNRKLNGSVRSHFLIKLSHFVIPVARLSRKENTHRSIWNENDQSSRQRV